jgi:asparagine synthase (glutamine-hydrolysing)
MCGILGLYDPIGFNRKKFINSLDFLIHRGPDNQSIKKLSDELIFGHTRLAIIDLDVKSNQPFSIDNNYFIIFNGEIFNYKELRVELEKEGYKFRTKSDTEVLLFSYIKWGHNCTEKLNGMWAFSIYDKVKNQIFCSRDRYGIKPFYYLFNDGKFMFSSMIISLINYYEEFKKPNLESINEFIYRGYISQLDDTWFKGIKRLKPGCNLVYDFENIKITKYYKLNYRIKTISFKEAGNRLKSIFNDSVNIRLRSDVKIASTLTSGLDSSAIVATIGKSSNETINTYTIYSKNENFKNYENKAYSNVINYDESRSIEHFSKYNLNPKIIKLSTENYFENLIECISYIESGHASPAIVAINQLYKEAKKNGHKVLLEGQGSDEIFGGYVTLLIYDFIKQNFFRPIFLYKSLKKILKLYSLKYLLLKQLNSFINHNLFLTLKVFILRNRVTKDFNLKNKFKNKNTFHFQQVEILRNLLIYGDSISMKNSIETRLPFLDYRLVDFANSLPLKYKFNKNKGKFILRESMKHIIPKEIYNSEIKNGFNMPISKILKTSKDIKKILYAKCNHEFFDDKKLIKVLDKYYKGETSNESFIFKILTTKIWFSIYFQNK